MVRTTTAYTATLLVALLLSGQSLAAPQASDNDSQGFDDGLLLEGLDSLIAPPEESPDLGPPPAERRGSGRWLPNQKELKQRMKDSLDGKPLPDQLGEDLGESPLVTLRSSMDRAGRLIAKGDDGGETRPTQEAIVSQLDELIKKMEQECKNCQGGGSSQQPKQQQTRRSKPSQPKPGQSKPQQAKNGKPSKPSQSQNAASQSSFRLGQAEAAAAEAQRRADAIKRVWGRLPERLREQMLQSTSDEYLPEYRDEIERYFERLAEESENN